MKKYILKQTSDENRKEVYFYPTDRGKTILKGHTEFEKKFFSPLYEIEKNMNIEDHKTVFPALKKLYNQLNKEI